MLANAQEVRLSDDATRNDSNFRSAHDCMDAGGRATQEQLPSKHEQDGCPSFWLLFVGQATKSNSPRGEIKSLFRYKVSVYKLNRNLNFVKQVQRNPSINLHAENF